MCFVAAGHLSSTMGRSVFTACSDKTPLFPEHSISEGLPATQRLQRVPFGRPCEPWTPETRWKRRGLPWGGKGFFPFKFLNFSSAVEVQTTEPRRLKRKATKEVTNQRTLSTAQLLLFDSQCMPVSLKWTAAHKPFFTKSTHCVKECVQLAKELACCLWTALLPLSLSLHSFTLFGGRGWDLGVFSVLWLWDFSGIFIEIYPLHMPLSHIWSGFLTVVLLSRGRGAETPGRSG